jgi:hypothetical protein
MITPTTHETTYMKKFVLITACLFTAFFSLQSLASDKPEHFKGLVPKNIEEAVNNFSEYNARLAKIIEQKKLSPEDMHTVHQLTYTIENSLIMLSTQLGSLSESLEAVHIASEHADPKTVLEQGKSYIDTAKKIIQ